MDVSFSQKPKQPYLVGNELIVERTCLLMLPKTHQYPSTGLQSEPFKTVIASPPSSYQYELPATCDWIHVSWICMGVETKRANMPSLDIASDTLGVTSSARSHVSTFNKLYYVTGNYVTYGAIYTIDKNIICSKCGALMNSRNPLQ